MFSINHVHVFINFTMSYYYYIHTRGRLSNDLYNHKLTNQCAVNILSNKFNSQSKESIVQYIPCQSNLTANQKRAFVQYIPCQSNLTANQKRAFVIQTHKMYEVRP